MSISRVITNETHLGIGTLPVSQRATVTRWTPRASASPDCVIPCSVRSAIRVSGFIRNSPIDGWRLVVSNLFAAAFDTQRKLVLNLAESVPPVPFFGADGTNAPRHQTRKIELVERIHWLPQMKRGPKPPMWLAGLASADSVDGAAGAKDKELDGVDCVDGEEGLCFLADDVQGGVHVAGGGDVAGVLAVDAGGNGESFHGFGSLFLGKPSVARRYSVVSNLYQTRIEI